ncbi:hypothetical protein [Streptomyces sp. NPDC003943]
MLSRTPSTALQGTGPKPGGVSSFVGFAPVAEVIRRDTEGSCGRVVEGRAAYAHSSTAAVQAVGAVVEVRPQGAQKSETGLDMTMQKTIPDTFAPQHGRAQVVDTTSSKHIWIWNRSPSTSIRVVSPHQTERYDGSPPWPAVSSADAILRNLDPDHLTTSSRR